MTSNAKFYSVAAVYHGRIIGMVVAEIKDLDRLPKEDSDIVGSGLCPTWGNRGEEIIKKSVERKF